MTGYPSGSDIRIAEATMMAVSDILRKCAEKEVQLCPDTLDWLGAMLDDGAASLHIKTTAGPAPATF